MNTQNERSVGAWFTRLTFWQAVFIAILVFGLYATIIRFAQGLGAATNLSDDFPWGLWIGFDVLVGVGLAAGGFVVAATVHIFKIEKYRPIARPSILTAFLGYLLVIVAILFDLGRPYRIWHAMVMWNPHSVMFEVAWCVMLYTTVLALEFSPLLFERFNLQKPLKIIRTIYVPLVIAGVLLSTMHQSSLGTLYVIVPDKLHGLWYTPLLPVFFFISAVVGGLAMTIFESFMSHRAFGKKIEADLLQGLGRVSVVILAVYAVWRIQTLMTSGNLGLAFHLTPESVMFWGEMGLGVLLPMVLFATPAVRRNENGLFLAAMLTILGFIVNRLNVAITGMSASSGVTYVPSWMELAVTTAIVAVGFALFALATRYLKVFPQEKAPAAEPEQARPGFAQPRPAFSGAALVALWGLLLIGAAAVAYSIQSNGDGKDGRQSEPTRVQVTSSAVGDLRLPEPFTFPPSSESPGPVTFLHETHVDAYAPQCASCHASLFSITRAGEPIEGELSYERVHEGHLCASCHDGESAFDIEEDCGACHGGE